MAPTTMLAALNHRRLRSSSLATPKKKVIEDSENAPPATEVKRKSRRAKVTDVTSTKELLRGVSPASPIQKKSISSPLKAISLNSPSKDKIKAKLFDDSPKKVIRPDLSRLAEARARLSTAHPNEVVGREKQTKMLKDFLQDNLNPVSTKSKKKTQKSIYVHGPPGTGKTTCLKELLKEIPTKTRTVFVNCMTLGNSADIYAKVAEAICPKQSWNSKDEALEIVKEQVEKEKILLVLDEIDQLASKNEQVLYTLFEMPYLYKSKLILVGIANNLDLTGTMLPRLRVHVAFKPAELAFPAYSIAEVKAILKSRLAPFLPQEGDPPEKKPLFQIGALNFLAGKSEKGLCGDIRKVLDVCRRALELAEIEARKQTLLKPLTKSEFNIKPIDLPQILKVLNETYGSKINATNDEMPLQQKLLLASLMLMVNHRANKDITLGKLQETYAKVCKKRSIAPSEAGALCESLESRGILAVKGGGPWKNSAKDRKVTLRIDEGEVEIALKDKTLLSGILNDTDCIAK